MSVSKWDIVREHALHFPAAVEDFPWGESVVKVEKRSRRPPRWRQGLVHGPMFLWLGRRESEAHAVSVKLTTSYDEAVALAAALPTSTSGLGQWGWLTVRLSGVGLDLVCGWVEE